MAASQPVAPPVFGGGIASSPARDDLLDAGVSQARPDPLDASLSSLSGIGPILERKASEAGVETLRDLLWRVPRAVGDPPGSRLLEELELGQNAIVSVEIDRVRRVRTRKRGLSVVEARIGDSSGWMKATWFNQPWMADQLRADARYLLEGRPGPKGFVVAATEPLDGNPGPGASVGTVVRWNLSTAELPSELSGEGPRVSRPGGGDIGAGRWRRWTFEACRRASASEDPVPASLLRRRRFPGAAAAFREAHFPTSEAGNTLALERLAWEELLLYRAMLDHRRRGEREATGAAVVLGGPDRITPDWVARLPFRLTGDQQRAIAEIREELGSEIPMRRLLMGEVGSGKTVVAVAAALRAAESGAQAVLMAPTAVLAEQHATTVAGLIEGSGLRVGLLTGATPKAARNSLLAAASAGELDLLIGTHALLEPDLQFHRLGLAIIDEEHRFGVRQRSLLERKAPAGRSTHLLHMSATPIPRTLSLTVYGDLDVTTLRELPQGRKEVRTELMRESDRADVFARVREELDQGRQCFVVCPLIEESEELEVRAAVTEAERLSTGELAEYEVGLIHGRMNAAQKEVAMAAFADGRSQVLVSTTVIEVGIDVPNATVMVIEGAERFGLSQLHQLRGRIGRGGHGGTCFLLSGTSGARARRRLAELARESDGFRLAELDLEMRGEGEIAGTRQHGVPRFRVASLPRDAELLEAACEDLDWLGDGPGSELLATAGTTRFGWIGSPDSPTVGKETACE